MAQLNPAPFQNSVDINGGSISSIWQQWFSALYEYVTQLPDFNDPYIISPASGFNETIPDMTKVVTLDVPGALATGTLVLPVNPIDGQSLLIVSTAAVTTFSLTSGAATVKNAPTTLAAGIGVWHYYSAENTTWYRVQ